MTKVFILEDDEARITAFLHVLRDCEVTVAKWLEGPQGAKEKYQPPYDLMLLDHDLGGQVYVDSQEEETGAAFVRWLPPRAPTSPEPTVIVHSWNPDGAMTMVNDLYTKHYHVIRLPFGITLLKYLEEVSAMAKLLMLMGLPGSGKSYLADELVAQGGWVKVEKDDIREQLKAQGWEWSHEKEKADVIPARDLQIEVALLKGFNVVSSDTNFQRDHRVQMEKLARRHEAALEIRRIDTPLAVCLERNAERKVGKVPENVIRDMYNRYIVNDDFHWPASAPSPYVVPNKVKPDESLMSAIICDLDGTLSLFGDKRGPYDAAKCDHDECNPPIRVILEVFYRFMNWQIIYLSGREDQFRPQTETFLRNNHCPPGPLYMRATGDHRKDYIVKRELFDSQVRDKYNVRFVLDDRDQVVRMWRRELGLTCLQVAEGDF